MLCHSVGVAEAVVQHGGGRIDPWVGLDRIKNKNNALDASLDLQNYQKTTSDGSGGQRCLRVFSIPNPPTGLYTHAHAGMALRWIKVKIASEIAIRCRHLVYMSTQYDVSCRWLVAKPIVRPSEIPSHIRYLRTLQLARYYSYRLRIPVASELAHRVVALTYL